MAEPTVICPNCKTEIKLNESLAGPVQDAKARFSALLETCLSEGPQLVTKQGKVVAVLVPIRQWNALQSAGKRTLKQILLDTSAPTGIAIPARGRLKRRHAHAEFS